jgi:hypothetical protein
LFLDYWFLWALLLGGLLAQAGGGSSFGVAEKITNLPLVEFWCGLFFPDL